MTSVEVKYLEAKYNINIKGYNRDASVTSEDEGKVDFEFVECGHFKSLKPKNLFKNGTGVCSQCRMVDKYREKSNIKIDFNECTIKCLDCNKLYYREAYCLTKDINKFNCYCKLKRFGELSFYEDWTTVNDLEDEKLKLYRSYAKYNTGLNHSSDFYVLHDNKTFIIHLNDKSHRNEINRERDKYKLHLTQIGGMPYRTYNIYVCEKYYNNNKLDVIKAVRKQILECNAEDMWYKAQNVCFIDDGGNFHEYLREQILQWMPHLKDYDYYGNIIKTDEINLGDQDSMKTDEIDLKDEKIVE